MPLKTEKKSGIKHMVIFCLKYDKDSIETDNFLIKSKNILSSIEGVENFEVVKQFNPKNDYDFGFYMEFKDKKTYQSYNENPAHINYVKYTWLKEVERFLEIDFECF
jgi:hypothetical protein